MACLLMAAPAAETYVPEFTSLTPKLLPTTPVQEQLLPLASTHLAVAVLPTFKHVMAENAGGITKSNETMTSRYIVWCV